MTVTGLSVTANTELQVWDSSPQTRSYNSTSGSYNPPGGGYGFVKIEGNSIAPAPIASGGCPTGTTVKGQPIGGLNCPCNYPVGWGAPNVSQINPGLKNGYPSCKAPLQCSSTNGGGYGTSSCQR